MILQDQTFHLFLRNLRRADLIQGIRVCKDLQAFLLVYGQAHLQGRLDSDQAHLAVFIHPHVNIDICKIWIDLMIHIILRSVTFYSSLIRNGLLDPVCLAVKRFIEAEQEQFSLEPQFIILQACIKLPSGNLRPQQRSDILLRSVDGYLFLDTVGVLFCCKYFQEFFVLEPFIERRLTLDIRRQLRFLFPFGTDGKLRKRLDAKLPGMDRRNGDIRA